MKFIVNSLFILASVMLASTVRAQFKKELIENLVNSEIDRLPNFGLTKVYTGRAYRGSNDQEFSVILRNSALKQLASLDVTKFETASSAKSTFDLNDLTQGGEPKISSFPSGMPLGVELKYLNVSNSIAFNGYSGDLYFHFYISYAHRMVNGKPVFVNGRLAYENGPTASDRIAVEQFSRRILGRLGGMQSNSINSVRINSTNVSARALTNGEPQLNLSQYCAAKGIALNFNQQSSMASFSSSGKLIVLPLASNKIKIGSTWQSSRDASLLDNNQWYVPKSLLDAATGS